MGDRFNRYFGHTEDYHEYHSDKMQLTAVSELIVCSGLIVLLFAIGKQEPGFLAVLALGTLHGAYGTYNYLKKKRGE